MTSKRLLRSATSARDGKSLEAQQDRHSTSSSNSALLGSQTTKSGVSGTKRKPETHLNGTGTLQSKKVHLQTPTKRSGPKTGSEIVVTADGLSVSSSLSDRPAEPHRTNVPLLTPKGSRLVAYSNKTGDASPSKTGLPKPTTTTANLLKDACEHLIRVDPRLKPIVAKHYCRTFSPEGLSEECDPFKSLASGIVRQTICQNA